MATPRTAAATEREAQRPHILVVEDDTRMRRILQLLLADHWAIETAVDGRDALARARKTAPDLVLTDLVLPGLDGFGLIRELRASPLTRAVPVLVITGLTEESDRLRALEAGATDFIIKPFSERELVLRMSTHLEMAALRREAARRESEAHLRLVLDGALDAVASMNAEDVITYWNPQAETTFGWSAVEAVGRRFGDLVLPPEAREAHSEAVARYSEKSDAFDRRTETAAMRKDGTRFTAELAMTVVRGWSAPIFNAFARDVTRRRMADDERAQLLERAREASRAKDEFLAMLSHELRTPLSAIVGWAHMLRTGDLDDAMRERAIETIERNAKVQNQLIEDILDVSRIVAGKLHLEMRPMELARVVEAAVDTVGPVATARKVALEVTVDPGAALMVGDEGRLQQVAWNLLSNAIKFTPAGGRVSVHLGQQDGGYALLVRDTGAGIDPAFLPHVFERFRQGGASGARRHGGLGLGLSIVRHVVEGHGGTVEARSDGPGTGATFVVRLPATAPESDGRVPSVAGESESLARAPRLDGLRVLVVDDEPDARNLIAAVLQGRGAQVLMASSGAEGLEILKRERPDVLLSDISLAGEDGYDLIKKVRSLPADGGGRTPSAALTAYGRLEDRMKALSAGFQLHVPKPADPGELVTVVATLAGRT